MKCKKCGKDNPGVVREMPFSIPPRAEVCSACSLCQHVSVYLVDTTIDLRKEAKMTRAELAVAEKSYPRRFEGIDRIMWGKDTDAGPIGLLLPGDIWLSQKCARRFAEWILRGLEEA
jgi:hypothetical protein